MSSLRAATELAAELSPLHNNLGRAYVLVADQQVDLGQCPDEALAQARISLQRASEIAPNYVSPHYNLGFSYGVETLWKLQLGEDPETAMQAARDAYLKTLELDEGKMQQMWWSKPE